VEKGKFMHASSSRGVTISSVKEGYWRKHYWQARRLL
jgi:cell wall-associated NlpC family hydrolase